MKTEEREIKRMCLLCASDFHLEMILIPYIKERLEKSEFIIFTENNLEESIKILLDRINFDEETKRKIKQLNWRGENKIQELEKRINIDEETKEMIIIINGEYRYIEEINKRINELKLRGVEIIDCFHVGDQKVDIEEIKKRYKGTLNTQRI